MDLKARISAARAALESTEPVVAPVEIGGELVDLTFRPLPGHIWADITAKCPPRPGAILDGNIGFNSDAVARLYPLDHVLVDGEPLRVIDEATGNATWDVASWNEIFDVISSPSLKNVAGAIWGLNQLDPQKRINELGKARAGAQSKKPRSRSNSASRPAA